MKYFCVFIEVGSNSWVCYDEILLLGVFLSFFVFVVSLLFYELYIKGEFVLLKRDVF